MNETLQRTPREELLWLAALLEGEGCFTVNGKKSPNVVLSMTDQDVVEQASLIAGVGHVTGPYQPRNPKHKPTWRWKLSKEHHVFALCRAILPFMGTRRSEAIEKLLALDIPTLQEPIWVRVDKWENG